ncbi:hypothetical protein [Plantibacter elymi (nom. nud.)]|uniref:hypothetical protein n=1 Tax=Plantibacter elymi (nom. nud.) TaxID=199708 RepID=UPI00105578F1|nr:hypothetical protein [Plantibacter sp. VKM Ac-1784]
MDWADLMKTVAVLLVGAGISIGTSVVLDRLRFRRDEAAAETKRQSELAESRRVEAADHIAKVYRHLTTMWRYSTTVSMGSKRPAPPPEAVEAVNELWHTFQLIPDAVVREAVHNGLYALGNLQSLDNYPWKYQELGEDGYRQTVTSMRDVVAAYLRRDELPQDEVTQLGGVADLLDQIQPFN